MREDYCSNPTMPCTDSAPIRCWESDCRFQKIYQPKDYQPIQPEVHGHPEFYKILDELRDLHSRKNHDYAGDDPLSNLKMCEVGGLAGWKGVVVRLTDKISRLLTFMKKGEFQVKDESVEDTFKDAAIYSILGLVLYRESKNETQTDSRKV
jgi:hypothetical protein